MVVRKSRYRAWTRDQRLAGYAAARDLAPVLTGTVAKAAGLEDFDPGTTAHEELMELLKSLGSDAKGGRIPLARMREYLALAKNNEASESEVRKAINEVKRTYGETGNRAA